MPHLRYIENHASHCAEHYVYIFYLRVKGRPIWGNSDSGIPKIFDCGIRNRANICFGIRISWKISASEFGILENFWIQNPEIFATLVSGIQLKESGILLTIRIRNRQVPLTKYSVGIQYLESEIHGLESRIQDCLGFPYMGWERARQLFATFSVVISASQDPS